VTPRHREGHQPARVPPTIGGRGCCWIGAPGGRRPPHQPLQG
jgi:hypothetical protein